MKLPSCLDSKVLEEVDGHDEVAFAPGRAAGSLRDTPGSEADDYSRQMSAAAPSAGWRPFTCRLLFLYAGDGDMVAGSGVVLIGEHYQPGGRQVREQAGIGSLSSFPPSID